MFNRRMGAVSLRPPGSPFGSAHTKRRYHPSALTGLMSFGSADTQIGDKIVKTKYVKSVPHEVLWMKFAESSYRGIWRDYGLADQDDVRAEVDMSQAKVIYKEGRLLISKLVEVL